MSVPSVRARLARSRASRLVPWLTSCSNRRTSRACRADKRVGKERDQQDREAVAERPFAIDLSGTPARGCTPASSNAGKQEESGTEQERGQADEPQRTANERARAGKVIPDDGEERAAREAADDECRQPGQGERCYHGEENRLQAHGPFEEGWCHAMQDSRCAGARKIAVVPECHCCLAVKGCFVIGSIGTVGFASHASSLSTTSMTPYMRTQWPGNVQT